MGLLDVDLHGPSIAGMMGVSGLLDVTPDKLAIPKAYGDNREGSGFVISLDQSIERILKHLGIE